jgi:hypothetical protein
MGTDPRLENYLSAMERVLKPFPVSDRADIVTEIKSHVHSALERDPKSSLNSVLGALGAPEHVANRYLLERGLKPIKPPVSPVVKWLVIGFLGTMAMMLLFAGVILMRFSPLFTVDEASERVTVLGGLVDIDGKAGTVRIGSSTLNASSHKIQGSKPGIKEGAQVSIAMGFGKLSLETSLGRDLAWTCWSNKAETKAELLEEKDGYRLNFRSPDLGKCVVSIPQKTVVFTEQTSGRLRLEKPRFHVTATLSNGKAEIEPDASMKYAYDNNVRNGKMSRFTSSSDPTALRISVIVQNGKIELEDSKEDSNESEE